MSIASLSNIMKIFGGGELTPEERKGAKKEATLLVLARATASDSNIKTIEVDTVRAIVENVTGEDVTEQEVRHVAQSELFEAEPIEKRLRALARQIDLVDRVEIAEALADVIKSDDRISSREVTFFNMVAGAFNLTPAELAGLIET